ncbi:MAG: glycosyltransferase family 4 protein [Betaproteobacteria bacterium]|nr:glycosyltransferase family 4 protein [Betaproteobacteria bacterium]
MLKLFLLSLLVSALCGFAILRFREWHARFTGDHAAPGTHKIHKFSVPRIGGLMVLAGWLAGLIGAVALNLVPALWAALLVFCAVPAFVGGMVEDLTKRVSPLVRLLLTFASAGLAYWLLGVQLTRLDLPVLDQLLSFSAVAFLFTIVAVGGVAHSVNIIDGLNGLAAGICLVALVGLGYVAFKVNDPMLLVLCVIGAGAVLGFHLWNHPSGLIFCGDGGAYFIGFYIATLAVMLVQRHAEVSPWFPLMLLAHPIWETLFSAYRRRFHGKRSSTAPDQLHFHTLAYKRFNSFKKKANATGHAGRRNSDIAVFFWMLSACAAGPAMMFWNDSSSLMLFAAAYIVLYIALYRRLVRFQLSRRAAKPAQVISLREHQVLRRAAES